MHNNTEYNLTCSGLVGAACTNTTQCDAAQELQCAALYDGSSKWARWPHCLEKAKCDKDAEAPESGTHVCYPGPPEALKCETKGAACDVKDA